MVFVTQEKLQVLVRRIARTSACAMLAVSGIYVALSARTAHPQIRVVKQQDLSPVIMEYVKLIDVSSAFCCKRQHLRAQLMQIVYPGKPIIPPTTRMRRINSFQTAHRIGSRVWSLTLRASLSIRNTIDLEPDTINYLTGITSVRTLILLVIISSASMFRSNE